MDALNQFLLGLLPSDSLVHSWPTWAQYAFWAFLALWFVQIVATVNGWIANARAREELARARRRAR